MIVGASGYYTTLATKMGYPWKPGEERSHLQQWEEGPSRPALVAASMLIFGALEAFNRPG